MGAVPLSLLLSELPRGLAASTLAVGAATGLVGWAGAASEPATGSLVVAFAVGDPVDVAVVDVAVVDEAWAGSDLSMPVIASR